MEEAWAYNDIRTKPRPEGHGRGVIPYQALSLLRGRVREIDCVCMCVCLTLPLFINRVSFQSTCTKYRPYVTNKHAECLCCPQSGRFVCFSLKVLLSLFGPPSVMVFWSGCFSHTLIIGCCHNHAITKETFSAIGKKVQAVGSYALFASTDSSTQGLVNFR